MGEKEEGGMKRRTEERRSGSITHNVTDDILAVVLDMPNHLVAHQVQNTLRGTCRITN